jgi:predicted nuclease of predicted toxin-antitoxin system
LRFLVDQNRSPRLAELLRLAGHDATHTVDLGLERATDEALIAVAVADERVIVSGDTDFGALLALARQSKPSVVLFRQRRNRRAEDQARTLFENLDAIEADLERGAVVVFEDARIRVRHLPLVPPDEPN